MATTSAPLESQEPRGRPGVGAAAARTESLYDRHGRTVVALCRALLRDRTEAEDAAQQTFLAAHRALVNGVEPREPAAWLATIARHECWARIRARMREPLPSDVEVASASDPAADPVAEALRRADLAALGRAIAALPPQQRDALLLREFGGLSYDELAAALAVTTPAVESLLFRARTRLRSQLRAAYASLGGAPWLDALARVFAGGSAPVAAKVAAVGLGAAAVTGGAVVAPQVLERPHLRPPAPRHTTAVASILVPPAASAPVAAAPAAPARFLHAVRVARVRSRHHARPAESNERRGRRGDDPVEASSGRADDRRGDDGRGDEAREAASGPTAAAEPKGDRSGPGRRDDATTRSGSDDGLASGDGGGTSGRGGSDSSGSGSGESSPSETSGSGGGGSSGSSEGDSSGTDGGSVDGGSSDRGSSGGGSSGGGSSGGDSSGGDGQDVKQP
ncbi:MAG TPA: sigma-70 family RNA polymerase sigma factor [Gaiellaceae bacterium]|nr:sigma-70 family RNA polymerase sigma factor [Gaiellaceae bacterium]